MPTKRIVWYLFCFISRLHLSMFFFTCVLLMFIVNTDEKKYCKHSPCLTDRRKSFLLGSSFVIHLFSWAMLRKIFSREQKLPDFSFRVKIYDSFY